LGRGDLPSLLVRRTIEEEGPPGISNQKKKVTTPKNFCLTQSCVFVFVKLKKRNKEGEEPILGGDIIKPSVQKPLITFALSDIDS